MHRSYRFIASLFLAGALVAPVSAIAAPSPQIGLQVRVYDRDHHDYHNWDDREDRAYRGLSRGECYPDLPRLCVKQNRRSQSNYWKWRHDHPDHD